MFIITINTAQGQTLKHIQLYFTKVVFTYEQLYITASHVINDKNLQVIVSDTPEVYHEGKIKNIVYSEVFN